MSVFGSFLDKVKNFFSSGSDKKAATKTQTVDTSESTNESSYNTVTPITSESPHTSSSGNVYTRPSDYMKASYPYSHDYAEKNHSLANYWAEQINNPESRFNKNRLVNQKYEELVEEQTPETVTDRGLIDRIFGLLGYNGITQGLYYALDDDDSTTFTQGLKEGLHYMNPTTDDVSNRKTMSDVLKLSGWTDDDPDHISASDVARGITGFALDVVSDPLTYLNPLSSLGKLAKGSGYTTKGLKTMSSLLEQSGKVENATKAKVAKYISGLDESNKLSLLSGVTEDEIADIMTGENGFTYFKKLKEENPERFSEIVKDYHRDYNATINHINVNPEDDGLSLKLSNLPFLGKKAQSLKATLVSSNKLRQIGDSTISPYFNTLTQSLRGTRLANKFSTNTLSNKVAKGEIGYDATSAIKQYVLNRTTSGAMKAMQDADDITFATELSKMEKNMTEEERYNWIESIEDGSLSNSILLRKVKDLMSAKGKDFDEATSNLNLDSEVQSNLRKAVDTVNNQTEYTGKSLSELIKDSEDAANEVKELRKIYGDDVSPYRQLYYSVTGKLPSESMSDDEIESFINVVKKSYDTDIVRSYNDYLYNGKGSREASSLFIKNIIENPKAAFNQANEAINNMSTEELNSFLAYHAISKDDTETLEGVYRQAASRKNSYYTKVLDSVLDNPNASDDMVEWAEEMQDRIANAGKFVDRENLIREYTPDEILDELYDVNKTLYNQLKDSSGSRDSIFDRFQSAMTNFNNGYELDKSKLYAAEARQAKVNNDLSEYFKFQNKENIVKLRNKNQQAIDILSSYIDKGTISVNSVWKQFDVSRSGAAKILDELEEYGLITAKDGTRARTIAIDSDELKSAVSLDDAQRYIDNFNKSEMWDSYRTIDRLLSKDARFGSTIVLTDKIEDMADRLDEAFFRTGNLEAFVKLLNESDAKFANNEDMFNMLRQFEERMQEIGENEASLGLLKEEQVDAHNGTYVKHLITDEFREMITGGQIPFKTGTGGFKGAFGEGAKNNQTRRAQGTIKELNKYYKEKYGIKAYNNSLAEIYFARTISSNDLIFATEGNKFLRESFSEPLIWKKGETFASRTAEGKALGTTYNELNKFVQQQTYTELRKDAREAYREYSNEFSDNNIKNAERIIDSFNLSMQTDDMKNTFIDLKNQLKELRSRGEDDIATSIREEYIDRSNAISDAMHDCSIDLGNAKALLKKAVADGDTASINKYQNLIDEANRKHYELSNSLNEIAVNAQKRLYEESPYYQQMYMLNDKLEAVAGQIDTLTEDARILESMETSESFTKRYMDNAKYNGTQEEARNKILSRIFGDDEKAKTLFTPNIPFQKLTEEQANNLHYLGYNNFGQYTEDIADSFNKMSKTQKASLNSEFLNLYDKFLTIWKINETIVSPGFHIQNAVSNAFQSYLGLTEGAMNPSKIKKAYDVLKLKDPNQKIKLGGTEYTYKQLENYAKHTGVIDESFASYDFGTGKNVKLDNGIRSTSLSNWESTKANIKGAGAKAVNPLDRDNFFLYQIMSVPGTNIETVQRMNLFMCALNEGQTVEEASRTVNKYLFDYGDLTNFEEDVLKRIIPFYTFMRKNIPMELKAMIENPSKFTKIDKALTEFELMDENGYIDENNRNEWRLNWTQIPYTNLAVNLNLPYQTLNRFTPTSNASTLDKVLGMSTPLIKSPIEVISGQNLYTGMGNDTGLGYAADQTLYGSLANGLLDTHNDSVNAESDYDKNKAKNAYLKSISSFLLIPTSQITPETALTSAQKQAIREQAYQEVYGE